MSDANDWDCGACGHAHRDAVSPCACGCTAVRAALAAGIAPSRLRPKDDPVPVGVTADGALAFAPPAEPEPAHPAPWRWGRTEDLWTALLDANGRAIISYQGGADMDIGTPGARTLIAAAPEMEALLRKWQAFADETMERTWGPFVEQTKALLARLPRGNTADE